MRWKQYLARLLFAAAMLCTATSWAHPGGHGIEMSVNPNLARTWTLAADGTRLVGAFVAAQDDKVQIRGTNGALTTLTIGRLMDSDQEWIGKRRQEIAMLNAQQQLPLIIQSTAAQNLGREAARETPPPAILEHFKPFEKALKFRWDEGHFYVESNGLPDHPMMIGIRAWQQQVPLPQKYFGDNAWRIPLHPVPAKEPMSTKGNFLRGAIALAINGIPIFNPLNNRGDDAFLFGELDEYGGHCGRADDYHYHLAPVHLEKLTGAGKPIAYALDGYPIFGYQDPQAPDFAALDKLNGHKDKAGNYHYHATKTYPYLNGGFYGEVVERGGQVDPQPRAEPLRPALTPLRDAKIVDFKETEAGSYVLTYDLRGKKGTVSYKLAADGTAKFVFVDENGKSSTETYTARRRPPDGKDRQPPPPRKEAPPPREEKKPPQPKESSTPAVVRDKDLAKLTVTSTSVDAKGLLSVDCTCDGARQSPAVAWKDAPAGTKFFALSLWHTAPDQEKSYWLVLNIPADVTEIKQNAKGVGEIGLNDRKRAEYDPMCSKGPGLKKYHVTIYALSAAPKLTADKASRSSLLAAIKGITLAEGTLDFQYERK